MIKSTWHLFIIVLSCSLIGLFLIRPYVSEFRLLIGIIFLTTAFVLIFSLVHKIIFEEKDHR